MSEYYINIPLNAELIANIRSAGMEQHITHNCEKKIIQICINVKEQKKLMKKFCDLKFDENNACVLPEESNKILMNLILQMQSLDVMKVAIMKLYNPLAGRDVFGRGTGCR
jgi:hypothetical protein